MFDELKNKVKDLGLNSPRSRSFLLYLVFLLISSVLWLFVTSNDTITTELEIPVEIKCPSNVHFLSDAPTALSVNVNAHGFIFFKALFNASPKLELRFADYADGNGQFKVEPSQLKKALGKLLGHVTILSVLPGEITMHYTDLPGKRVPVVLDIDVEAAPYHCLTGLMERTPDSVTVYGDSKTLKSINEVYSYHVKEVGLTDTLTRRVNISPVKGAVVDPKSIEVIIPIEKMVTKTQKVQISVRNAPKDVNVVVFPSKVDATFRVPISYYKSNNAPITAVVDYNSININTPGNKVELLVGEAPGAYDDVRLSLDSVEYIIERRK